MMASNRLVKKMSPVPDGLAHDWWFLAGASLFFDITFFPNALCAYRLHNSNVCGARGPLHSLFYYVANVKKAKVLVKESLSLMKALLNRFGDELQDNKRQVITDIVTANRIYRKYLVWNYGVLPQTFIRRIGYTIML